MVSEGDSIKAGRVSAQEAAQAALDAAKEKKAGSATALQSAKETQRSLNDAAKDAKNHVKATDHDIKSAEHELKDAQTGLKDATALLQAFEPQPEEPEKPQPMETE